MSSLRSRARCIGLGDDFSVAHDVFGHVNRPADLELREHIQRLFNPRIDLNIIRVGIDQYDPADVSKIDLAVEGTRDIFATRGLAVGRVLHWDIPTAQAGGYEHINSDDEAFALADDWSVDNDALDVFMVLSYEGDTVGRSAIDGPCDKDDSKDMEGSVIAIDMGLDTTILTLAHEIGHYLGLRHVEDVTRLMNPSSPNGGLLTPTEGSTMHQHCFVKPSCPS